MVGRLCGYASFLNTVRVFMMMTDMLSKRASAVDLKGKSGSEIPGDFKTMFNKRQMPQKLQTDHRKKLLKQPLSKL